MTIRRNIDARALNIQWSAFEDRVSDSSDGLFAQGNKIADVIADAADNLIREIRAIGLKADTCDGIREVEAVIYGWVKASNPDRAGMFASAEGIV